MAATVNLMPVIKQQYFDINGLPLAFGQIFTYTAGSSTPQATYSDAAGVATNTNPIVLDASGRADIWLDVTKSYKFIVQNSLNVTQFTEDNISGSPANSGSVTSLTAGTGVTITGATYPTGALTISTTATSVTEWTSGPTPSFLTVNSFSVGGNQTGIFSLGRRVKATVSAGTVYGTVSQVILTSVTTVVLAMDGTGVLDSGLSAVSYGFVSTASSPVVYGSTPISLVSASTVALGNAASYNVIITGNTTITSFDTVNSGLLRNVKVGANSYPIITYNSTSMITPGGVDLVLNPNDNLTLESLGSGNWQVVNFLPATGYVPTGQNPVSRLFPVTATVSGSVLTVGLNPCRFDIGNGVLTNGIPQSVNILSPLSLSVPINATLGMTNNSNARLVIVAYYYGGNIELGIVNMAGHLPFDETQLINTSTISASSTANNIIYSTIGRSNVPYRVVGLVDYNSGTAGTWNQTPTLVQGVGGNTQVNAFPEVLSYTNQADTGTITRSHIGPVKITYIGFTETGGSNTIAWAFYLNGVPINSRSVGVNYQVAFNPSWIATFVSNGSFNFRTTLYGDSGAYFSQFCIEYL